jgi:hypothetical protein
MYCLCWWMDSKGLGCCSISVEGKWKGTKSLGLVIIIRGGPGSSLMEPGTAGMEGARRRKGPHFAVS